MIVLNTHVENFQYAKIKGVFDGPQIRSFMADDKFDATMNTTELEPWQAFKVVVENFLGNYNGCITKIYC